MAGSSLLMLIDDIATVLDDVALMTKMAAPFVATGAGPGARADGCHCHCGHDPAS